MLKTLMAVALLGAVSVGPYVGAAAAQERVLDLETYESWIEASGDRRQGIVHPQDACPRIFQPKTHLILHGEGELSEVDYRNAGERIRGRLNMLSVAYGLTSEKQRYLGVLCDAWYDGWRSGMSQALQADKVASK